MTSAPNVLQEWLMGELLRGLGLSGIEEGAVTGSDAIPCHGPLLEVVSPVDGRVLGAVRQAVGQDYDEVAARASEAFLHWRMVPAPKRGEVVRQIAQAVRDRKRDLAELIALEMGKILPEAEGEVQEMIDIADFSVGLSRTLCGLTMHSERPQHRMYEQWHPLGPIGVVTAFNFPLAVWSWNAMVAMAAGDTVIWKPSSKTPLTALAVMKIISGVLKAGGLPEGILNVVVGERNVLGERLIHDRRLPLVSATGSVAMGRHVAQAVSARLGRSLLELGGNNGVIVTPSADLDLTIRAVLFGAVGTAGQRCTTIRRAIVQKGVYHAFLDRLTCAYRQVVIGHPLQQKVLMGPLIDRDAVAKMQLALGILKEQGGRVLTGGDVLSGGLYDAGTYVVPCICEARPDTPIVQQETFAPILYVMPYETIEEAVLAHNAVPQGLSSAIFTNDLRESEFFLSHLGSDCGIANVNVGTSGAEIGGAFGGEKDTGGGREAGSDAWKWYMRRQTTTINWSRDLPLAQGIRFGSEG